MFAIQQHSDVLAANTLVVTQTTQTCKTVQVLYCVQGFDLPQSGEPSPDAGKPSLD